MNISIFFKLLRSNQWVKNVFVLAGFLFADRLTDLSLLKNSLFATFVFCLASSAIYIFNDCIDRDEDQKHPLKKNRPIASRKISLRTGYAFFSFLSLVSLGTAIAVNTRLFSIIFLYLCLNSGYTLFLKKMVIMDVFCIALGFMLRMLAGTFAVDIPPSHWIIICTLMLSLFLGFSKRFAEVTSYPDSFRSVLNDYTPSFLMLLLGISTSCTIISYGLYTISPGTIQKHGEILIYTLPIVIFGLFRYLFLVLCKNKGENPSYDIFHDSQLVITGGIYILSILFWSLR